MLGSIEDLDREIELFRTNIAASKEMHDLLSQMISQIKKENDDFNRKSEDLLSRLDEIPSSLDKANSKSNDAVKKDVSEEVDRAIRKFASEQDKYLQVLDQVRQKIQYYMDQSRFQTITFEDTTSILVSKVEEVPAAVDNINSKRNVQLCADIKAELETALKRLSEEQTKYVQSLEQVKQEIQLYTDQSQKQIRAFDKDTAELIEKINETHKQINNDTRTSLAEHRAAVDTDLEKRNLQFAEVQQQFLAGMQNTDEKFKGTAELIKEDISASLAEHRVAVDIDFEKRIQQFYEVQKRLTAEMQHTCDRLKKTEDFIATISEVPDRIKNDADTSLAEYRSAVDSDLENRNQQLLAGMQDTSNQLKHCEEQLLSKYQEFITTLESTNMTNLYEQNQKLQSELNRKTAIIMVISAISVILGVVGLLL